MAELHEDRNRALSFGAIAADYDRLRPRYAAATVDAIADGARTAADIGAGTGILARQLRDRGVDVLAVEPDGAMAGVARASGVPAEVATFKEWDAAGRTFDLVTFGQSFHWVDADRAIPRLAALLNPGGRVALLWNRLRPTRPANEALRAASPDYVNVEAAGAGSPHDQMYRMAELRGRFEADGFTVSEREDSWIETQSAGRWLDLVFTYSAHSTLPEDRRAALRAALAEVIGDGDVELVAGTTTLIAQR
ncbi:bifunctional 2-polyprenyl-6-hydroxyphenol methylase/3-demethylubiquinol 3-O-methyltransferase UbiG [Tsukamurella sp. 1534]|uniref:class I SAM-dependent methyltransferase n=1 Tax=Tsukamurella sp. 1534 TaxID=1151061 RepID=UPI0002E0E66D|nr:class I SAM-dependent methyltransferase [Tsukamurella sp. 1534]